MKYLIIILIVFYSNLSLAQKWDHIFGTPNHTETPKNVIESYDKGYLISGSYKIPTSSNWLIKTDINGDILWDKVILHDYHGVYKGALSQNSSGEIVLSNCLVINSDTWPSVIKLDSCGNKIWCRTYIDENYFWGAINDVILYENGDVLALGWLESEEEIDKIFLYYIDSNGNLIWRKSYASKNDHPLVMNRIGGGVHQFDNEYIITGRCHYPYPGNPNAGYIRPFFIGVDSLFNEKWILPFGVSDSLYGEAYSVYALNDTLYMGIAVSIISGTALNTILTFFNKDGEEMGYSQILNESIGPDIVNNISGDIARLNDTLFITSTSFGPNNLGNPFGELIIDTSGNVYKSESRPNTEGISTLIRTFDDKYVIGCTYRHPNNNKDIYLYKINDSLQHDTVYTGNYVYDSLCPYQIESGIIDITDCMLITDVGEVPGPKEYFAGLNTIPIKAYPNPVKEGSITFEYSNTEYLTPPSVPPQGGKPPHLCIFNVYGEMVHEEKVYQHQGESRVNVDSWRQGMYIALIYSSGRVVGQTKFVVQ